MHPEAIVLPSQRIQIILQEDILETDVCEYQIDFRGILPTIPRSSSDYSPDDLEHRRNASSTGNHTEVPHHTGRIYHCALGPFDLQGIANVELGNVLGYVTGRIGFDQEVDVSRVLVRGDWSVRAHDLFRLALDDRGDGHVLADWEAEDVVGARKGKSIAEQYQQGSSTG